MPGMVIWITGLPGSGKSTVADEIKKSHPEFTLLRMDEIRKIATPEPTYSDPERDILYRALVYFAKRLSETGQNVIIDATGNLRVWRELARQLIPVYREVYLRCPGELCMLREQKRIDTHGAPEDIYRKGAEGWPVPGIAAPYEEPLSPEVTIDTDKSSLEEAVEILGKTLLKERKS
jgi:adenylylsulfate kinase